MSKSTIDASLFCTGCNQETEHQIEYLNGKITSITCMACGSSVHMDHGSMSSYYKEEVINRLLTKPVRMTREMQNDLNGFLKSLPHRVITKPYRVYKEWEENSVKEKEEASL